MARTRSQSETKDVSSDSQAKLDGDKTLSHKRFVNNEPTTKDDDKDEIVAQIEVAPRSSRRRLPSKRAQVTFAQPASSATPASKRPKTSTKKWTPEHVTQDKHSPLVNKDLRALLLHPEAWDVLGDEDKKELLDLFPDTRHILNTNTPDARPNVMSLKNDDNFRHDIEEYVSNLKAGMHDPAWLQDAWAAHEARAAGQFDEYYIRKLEVDWKTTIPDVLKPAHLRFGPPTEPNKETETEPTERSSSADQPAKSEEVADEAKEKSIRVTPVVKEATSLDKANGSEVVEGNIEAKGDDGAQDAVMASSTDGSAGSVTEDFQKVSVVNAHETVYDKPNRTSTAKEVD